MVLVYLQQETQLSQQFEMMRLAGWCRVRSALLGSIGWMMEAALCLESDDEAVHRQLYQLEMVFRSWKMFQANVFRCMYEKSMFGSSKWDADRCIEVAAYQQQTKLGFLSDLLLVVKTLLLLSRRQEYGSCLKAARLLQ